MIQIQSRTPRISVNAVFRRDPTRTLSLRNQFSAQMKMRFKKLKQLIQTSVLDNDCFGLNINWPQGPYDPFTRNQALTDQVFAFERNPAKVTKFMEWLQEQIDNEVLETIPGQQLGQAVEAAWTNTYIQTAYQKGMLRGRQELKGNSITGYEDIPPYGSQYGSLQKAFNSPFHADKVGLIYTRSYEGLKGITNEMSKQISGILAQGISEGWNPKKIAVDLTDRVDKIGITRATILARTEVIRAHHVAMVQEYKNWGVQGVIVQAEWTTAGDSRVCPVCSSLQGKVYTLEQIEPLIPRHPQCRCLALPVDVTDDVKPTKEYTAATSLAEAQKNMKSFIPEEAHKESLLKYSAGDYNSINGYFRGRKNPSPESLQFIETHSQNLDSFLQMAPKAEIESYRGVSLNKTIFDRWANLNQDLCLKIILDIYPPVMINLL